MDTKDMFQDWDKLNRYKVSPKQFRQVLATFNFLITDEEFEAALSTFTNPQGEIEYLKFLQAANPGEQYVNQGSHTSY